MTRVLVVEDDHDLAELVSWMLRKAGYEVDVAHDALAAMRYAPGVDAMVLDYNLPGTNGIALAELLRTTTHRPDMPCVLATAEMSPNVIAHATTHDHWWHVSKPFTSGDLQDVMKRALGAQQRGNNEQTEIQ